jgi:hypothetical protein
MKYLFSIAICTALIGWSGSAMALTYEDRIDFESVYLAEGPIADIFARDSFTYDHDMPSDFEVPWDIVNSATLTIAGKYINGDNDEIIVHGVIEGFLNSVGLWSWHQSSSTTIDLTSIFTLWPKGNTLDVEIIANGCFPEGFLKLTSSIFKLDYDNKTAPIPETTTTLLFAIGIVGLTGVTRRRRTNNA